MTFAERVGEKIRVDIELREKSLIQRVPGAKFKGGEWTVPLTWAACKQLRGTFGDRLEIGTDLEAWGWMTAMFVDETLAARGRALDPDADGLAADDRLFKHQRTAVAFLCRTRSGAILADEMGVGKTASALCAAQFPILVVAPKSMGPQWVREIKFWRGVDAVLVEGGAVARRKLLAQDADAYVVSWSLLWRHSRLAKYGSIALSEADRTPGELNGRRFGTVIADEAHRAKDPKAKQTRALWAVGDESDRRFALTGTPMEKNEAEFWSLLRFVSPAQFPSRSAFLDRYCQTSYNTWGGMEVLGLSPRTEPEFREIVNPIYLRRTKELVLPHLPAKVYERRDVEMGARQAKAYRQMSDGMVSELEGGTLVAFDPLVQGARLSQMASSTVEITDAGPRMCEPSPKVDELLEVLADLDGAPLAVLAHSRQLLDLAAMRLEKHAIPHARVVGGMTPAARDDAVQQYNSGAARVILISLGAGAEGLSLKRGSTELFLDRSWSQTQNKQGEDRLHGTGRGDADATRLTIIDLVTRGTVEEYRADYLAGKSDRFEDLVRDRDLLIASLRHGGK